MKSKQVLYLIFIILLGSSSRIYSDVRSYTSHLFSETPVVDGEIEKDIAWAGIPSASQFTKMGTNTLSKTQTEFKIGYTANAIYIAIKCFDPNIAKIKAELKDKESLWFDDSIEIFLYPSNSKEYLHLVCNAAGSRWNSWGSSEQSAPLLNWQAKVYKGKNFYSMEIRIPFEIFKKIPLKNEIWKINIARNILTSRDDRYSTWSPLDAGFHQFQKFARLVFASEIVSTDYQKAKERILGVKKKEIAKALSGVEGEMKRALSIADKYKLSSILLDKLVSKYNDIMSRSIELDSIKKASKLVNEISVLKGQLQSLQYKLLMDALFVSPPSTSK